MVSQERCTSEQIATAVVLWCVPVFPTPILCKVADDCLDLRCLDLIISTVDIFCDGFESYFQNVVRKNYQELPKSKMEFLNFIKIRSLLLSEKNDCFHMFLTCAFLGETLAQLYFDFECCHFAKTASKCLSYILGSRFKEVLETDAGWESLMAFCRKMHLLAYRRKSREGDQSIVVSKATYECEISSEFPQILVKKYYDSLDENNNEIVNEEILIEENIASLNRASLEDINLIKDSLDNSNETIEPKLTSEIIHESDDVERNREPKICNFTDEITYESFSVNTDENFNKIDSEELFVNVESEGTKNEFQTHTCRSNIGIDKCIEKNANSSTGNGKSSFSRKSIDGMVDNFIDEGYPINPVKSDLCSDTEQQYESDDDSSDERFLIINCITETPEFLSEIKMLLLECEKNIIDKNFEIPDCEIQVSDNEEIENITVRNSPKRDRTSLSKVVFRETAIDDIKELIRDKSKEYDEASRADKKNEITDEDSIRYFFNEILKPSEKPHCELCNERANEYIGNWFENFHEGNKNLELISDVF
ncbi:hypothetical protein NPIL_442551 [Nephila pilipes]|uniref:Uncharacterized protein n=1 Tax=Nephila pilipes TaxID=299642 RepID=A0A8X6QNT5_NEPPI|nr:hypothetical protein NPIL_442551 [Nephila pilipes]